MKSMKLFRFSTAIVQLNVLKNKDFICCNSSFEVSTNKPESPLRSTVSSTFIGFYWAICIAAYVTSSFFLLDWFTSQGHFRYATPDDVQFYKDWVAHKEQLSNKDIANIANSWLVREQQYYQSYQRIQVIVYFFALSGLGMLFIVTVSGRVISK